MSRIRTNFYKIRVKEYTGKVPWKLKIGREHLPNAIEKVKQQEKTDDIIAWIEEAENWLSTRSQGTDENKNLSKSEIKKRKIELGVILTEYNRYHSKGDRINF